MQRLIEKYKQEYFYYLLKINNLPSILEHGILSFNTVKSLQMKSESFASKSVEKRRAERAPVCLSSGNNRSIHDLVPLYLTPRTPTLFMRLDLQGFLCFAVIRSQILFDPNIEFVFTDGNVGSKKTVFYYKAEDLNKIPWQVIRAKYWTRFPDGTRKRNSEFLIYPKIDLHYISKIIVDKPKTKQIVERIIASKKTEHIEVGINPWFFFD